MRVIILAASLLVSSLAFSQNYRDSIITGTSWDSPTMEMLLVELINVERVKLGLAPLVVDSTLNVVAHNHSVWMAATSLFVHSNDLRTPNPKLHRQINYAENCAMYHNIMVETHIELARGPIAIWLDSPAHRANMLNPEFTTVGTGFALKVNSSKQKEEYFTAVFK
jgi:uncharacterized protein YkwD